ncbi:HlyD family type I secretion periplasmic adaptor subunit [Minwuia thermotolerans]|uniref:Membrane fusion protein (MFP) family protein n=1 Tax=Minwuia thermotolerans TaxID=2056226 RepID=A0A2M9FYT0_9PROT|nr:HlyD family type I secretion periplasmic adaptor subunit [Minwuia thermotolerans]PJK28626.1 HlyD family type I secretion periplasmic adaptor subunit [Minwuia thermotolerans]
MTTEERIERLQIRARARGWRVFALIVILLVIGFGVWAGTAQLDEVAVAPGEVKPQGKLKKIQHLEGGIVEEILVSEGQIVAANEPLIRIGLAPNQANREELLYRVDALKLSAARHRALASGQALESDKPLEFPPEAAERHPDLVAIETEAYESRRNQSRSQASLLRNQLRQRQAELAELQSKARALEGNLAVARKRFEISAGLLEKSLTPRIEHLELEAEVQDLEGRLDTTRKAIPRVNASIDEARDRIEEEELRVHAEATEALSKTEQELGRLVELLSEATDQQLRATIRSPIDGVVKNLTANTIGGVVRPGEPIMEIVPLDETLVIQAKLNPVDRGYVEVGQEARVKITAYDFFQYGALNGRVIRIGADANRLPSGEPYFDVVIETRSSFTDKSGAVLPITPGMQAAVDIHTGDRSVLTYLLKPFLRLKQEGFRER